MSSSYTRHGVQTLADLDLAVNEVRPVPPYVLHARTDCCPEKKCPEEVSAIPALDAVADGLVRRRDMCPMQSWRMEVHTHETRPQS